MSQSLNWLTRKSFTEFPLSNNIKVHYRPNGHSTCTMIWIILPIGHLHNQHLGNGVAHFFEHIVLSSPQITKLRDFLDQKGGYLTGYTGLYATIFEASIPEEYAYLQPKLVDHIFSWNISESDINTQKTPIYNEKWGKSRFYPCSNELEYTLKSEWMNLDFLSPDFVFGSDENIWNMSISDLRKAQNNLFSTAVQVVAVGATIDPLLKALDTVSTNNVQVQSYTRSKIQWAQNPILELSSDSHQIYRLIWGGYIPRVFTKEVEQSTSFLLRTLDTIIQEEYREKRNLIYEVRTNKESLEYGTALFLNFTLSKRTDADSIKEELLTTMVRYLQNTQFMDRMTDREINDTKHNRCWNIVQEGKEALSDIVNFGEITSLEEEINIIHKYGTANAILSLFNEMVDPKTALIRPAT